MKYHRGFSNFHYRIKNGVLKPLPGAVKLNFKPQTVSRTTLVRLSDGTCAEYEEVFESGKKASLEIVSLPVSFLCDVLGYSADESGVLYEGRQKIVHFSLFYETKTDGAPIRHQLYDAVCEKPSFDVSTITNKPAPDMRKLELTVNPDIKNSGFYGRQISKDDNEEIFNNWFGLV